MRYVFFTFPLIEHLGVLVVSLRECKTRSVDYISRLVKGGSDMFSLQKHSVQSLK